MKKKPKVKYKIRDGLWPELYDTYWDDVIEKIESTEEIRITTKNNNFVMLKQMSVKLRNVLVEKIWFTYFGYLIILIDSLDYTNRVDFNVLKNFWVSDPMIKIVRKKLKDANIVKKDWSYFYLNPWIAQKWEWVQDFVMKLFDNK